jgi:hypothetical protein
MQIIADVTNQTFSFTENAVIDKNIYFGFTDSDGLPVVFDNLSFGYVVSRNGVPVAVKSFPKDGLVYESTDQEFTEANHIEEIKLGIPHSLFAWVENAGNRWEQTFSFTLPRLKKPYSSWSWDEEIEAWTPPVSYPTDGKLYEWNEEDQRWDEVNV